MEELLMLMPEDLPEGSRALAEFLGMELFIKLVMTFSGDTLYIPSVEKLRNCLRNRDIRDQFSGKAQDIPRLSRQYHLSERQIRNIVRRAK